MQNSDIVLMQEAEKKYWWHVGRRLVLQSILKRFFNRHSEFISESSFVIPSLSRDLDIEAIDPSTTVPFGTWQAPLRSAQDDKEEVGMTEGEVGMTGGKVGMITEEKMSSRATHPSSPQATHLSSRACRGICSLEKKGIKILDVGCGTGGNFAWLKEFGEVLGIDSSPEAVKFADQSGHAVVGEADATGQPDESYDLITAFDVLEHIKDDQSAIKEWHRVLNNGGYLFMTVPAYQWLFGPHDKNLRHYRRYNHSQLSHLLLLSSFKIVVSSYIFMFTFPVFLIQRLIAKTTRESTVYPQIPGFINNLFIMLSKLETWLIRFIRLPFGSSLIILARRQ